MKKITGILLISLFLCFGAFAKNLEKKKLELKKIYEAGGVTKAEYNKAQEFLENSQEKTKEKNSKQTFNLSKKTKFKEKLISIKNKDRDRDKEEVTLEKIDELGKIVKFDKSYYTDGMLKKFKGCGKGMKCFGQKAGSYMGLNFGKSPSWGQKYPGKMIKSMAMYEVFYASKLYETRKTINRFKENKYKSKGITKGIKIKGVDLVLSRKQKDEKAIRSLFGLNKGRKNMREALGMDMDTPTKEAIQKFWLLGEFLDLGEPTNNKITVNQDIKDRQDKLDVYKATISNLKKKLEERAEEKKSIKDKS